MNEWFTSPTVWYAVGFLGQITFGWHRRDPVFAIGQAAGLLVYVRNLTLHHGQATA